MAQENTLQRPVWVACQRIGGVGGGGGGVPSIAPCCTDLLGPQHQKIQAFELQLQFKQEVKPEPDLPEHLMFGPITVERKGRT